jgi:Ni,Fe-hydrogenase I cytochrome b subunit
MRSEPDFAEGNIAVPPAVIRPLLHTIHLLTFALLFVTGLLLLVPGLRAAVTGGYSLLIGNVHRWGGVAFAALPAAVSLRFGVRTVFAAPEVWTSRALWQGLHVAITVLISILFTATGIVLWGKRTLPESIVEVSHSVHGWLTYAAGILLAVHLLDVGVAAVVGRVRAAVASQRQSVT